MGLVVQSAGDALLALIAGPAVEGAATAAPADGGMFASLMAALLPDGSSAGSEGEAQGDGLGLPLPAEPEQETKTSNDAALALLTATTLVQFVPQPSTGAAQATTEAGIAPLTDATSAPAESAEAPAEDIAIAATDALDAAEQQADAPAAATAEVPEPQAIRPEARSASLESIDAAAEAPVEPGVVRSVGNAENTSHTDDGDGANAFNGGQSRRAEKAGPTPRASAQGIEHASANSPVGELRALSEATPLAESAPAEASAPVEVPQQVDQVADVLFESVEVGATEARLRLDPAEMGEVVIHIQSDGDGGVRVEIRAERPEAAQLLRDHTQDLSQLLGDRGLNLSDVNVGLGRGNNEGAFERGESRNDTPANGEFAALLGLDDPGSANRHNRLRSAYNPDGAHIYRV